MLTNLPHIVVARGRQARMKGGRKSWVERDTVRWHRLREISCFFVATLSPLLPPPLSRSALVAFRSCSSLGYTRDNCKHVTSRHILYKFKKRFVKRKSSFVSIYRFQYSILDNLFPPLFTKWNSRFVCIRNCENIQRGKIPFFKIFLSPSSWKSIEISYKIFKIV